ncbi:MAG: sulfite exporter TauE/SafE family protein, partial [Candidatus Puniceispirillum sp.]
MEHMTLSDPVILTASLIAVAFVGLSKGGLGGAFSLLGVPIMALFMPPLQAAALLLPIYLLMDAVSLWTWRGQWDKRILWQMVPAGLVGITIGWLTASVVSDAAVRLLVGLVALGFVVLTTLRARYQISAISMPNKPYMGHLWGILSGFTSFVAHAGGPPFQI